MLKAKTEKFNLKEDSLDFELDYLLQVTDPFYHIVYFKREGDDLRGFVKVKDILRTLEQDFEHIRFSFDSLKGLDDSQLYYIHHLLTKYNEDLAKEISPQAEIEWTTSMMNFKYKGLWQHLGLPTKVLLFFTVLGFLQVIVLSKFSILVVALPLTLISLAHEIIYAHKDFEVERQRVHDKWEHWRILQNRVEGARNLVSSYMAIKI